MFQTRKEKAKKTLFRSSHHQRKLHHIHMAVSDVKWSDNIYSIKEVIHTYRLPLLVKVTQGHFTGPDEDSLSQGQVSVTSPSVYGWSFKLCMTYGHYYL